MASLQEVLKKLESQARPEHVQGMASYGMTAERRLGVAIPDLRRIAKETGKDHGLALRLWGTGIPEAKILAAMIDRPEELTEQQMDEWVAGFNSWDVCDQVCMNLFEKSPLAWKKILEWSEREEEYVKRAAYALIACLAWHDKGTSDAKFIGLFPVIKRGATDERNYVKKAVSWALRNIGKRNKRLNRAALEVAAEIGQMDSRAARWIASDVGKELNSEAVQRRLGA
ncbi:MAG: DNA alkylation repair protein [candidate division KSB1 bacterium]|nr:DNA alkylation repair protein [candidate division KSB1 bacterium]MDZ7393317.1 DNA alkylation repair protein [candidate division KSB1 bacterium]MDZ7412152.1 DNA alkylation repair protein [candidate division KSB1 bacterium]